LWKLFVRVNALKNQFEFESHLPEKEISVKKNKLKAGKMFIKIISLQNII
jgi:hypothetical protein